MADAAAPDAIMTSGGGPPAGGSGGGGALDRLAAARPAMAPAAALLRALIAAADAAPAALPAGVPDDAAVRARLAEGLPALAGEPLLDGDGLARRVRVLADRLRALAAAPDAPDAVRSAAGAADGGARAVERLDADGRDALAAAALAGAWEHVAPSPRALDLDEHALAAVLDHAVRPTLREAASRVRAALDESLGRRAPRRRCPACGAPPLLAELRASAPDESGEGERTLRCGRCAAAWPVPRLLCTGCGTRDHRALGWLHGEGEEAFRRVQVCARCRAYIKELAVLAPLDHAALLEEDLATAGLDLVAAERGYGRGGMTEE
jgi:formate dehydrogenase accessory protein FdhE